MVLMYFIDYDYMQVLQADTCLYLKILNPWQITFLLIRDMVVDSGTADLAVKPCIPQKSLFQ